MTGLHPLEQQLLEAARRYLAAVGEQPARPEIRDARFDLLSAVVAYTDRDSLETQRIMHERRVLGQDYGDEE